MLRSTRPADLALLMALSLPFLFLKLGMPLLDPDEGLYASIAQEMLQRDDWVIPHINGLPYLEKPPLYFWLTAVPFWLVCPTEGAVRPLSLRELTPALGATVFVVITAPWHVLAAQRSPTLFEFYVLDNHLLRFLNARRFVEDDVPISTLGFLVATFLWAFPWGIFLPARPAPGSSPIARWRPVIPAWALVIVGGFSLSPFKDEYYGLPAFPALAILVGAGWASGRAISRWLGLGLLGCSVVGAWALWLGV